MAWPCSWYIKIALDVMSLGEIEENHAKLQALVSAAKTGDNRCFANFSHSAFE